VIIVLFPVVAGAHRAGERQLLAAYVRHVMRISLLMSGLFVSVTAGLPGPLLTLVFGADTALLATSAMRVLALGLGTLALFGVLTAILNSVEQPRLGLVVTALAFGFVVAACLLGVRRSAFGPELLERTALATSVALGSATLIAMLMVRRTAGAVLGLGCGLRALAALGVALGVAALLPRPSGLLTLVASGAVGGSYALALVLLGELGRADYAHVRRLFGKRAG
jgi:O-antigen/teichoic acid export membrane protein